MVPGFGRRRTVLGSAAHCEIVIDGIGVAPEHAAIEFDGQSLTFVDLGCGVSSVNGEVIPSGTRVPFDFRAQFALAGVSVPNGHSDFGLMLMGRGNAQKAGQVVFGRDPESCDITIQHPMISRRHMTLQLQPLQVIDHGTPSGTWLDRVRLIAEVPRPASGFQALSLGPVLVPVWLALALAKALESLAQSVAAVASEVPAQPNRAKYDTITTVVTRDSASDIVKTIGRTAENDIAIPHPQVSSAHALLRVHAQHLTVEDRGSSNGTYVRGQRIASGQQAPIGEGEKIFIGPIPLLITTAALARPPSATDGNRFPDEAAGNRIDVFISYAREDRPHAQRLAELLERHGYSVWWDRLLLPGASFEFVIEEALAKARTTIVLWSRTSVAKRYVRNEAGYALDHGRLVVPVLLEPVEQPVRFRDLQALTLEQSLGEDGTTACDDLLYAIARVGKSRPPVALETTLRPGPRSLTSATLSGAVGSFTVLEGQEMRVGRDPARCAILLDEPRVSAVHASVRFEHGELRVRDDHSNNGTLVDEHRLAPGVWAKAPSRAKLRFGPIELVAKY